MEHECGSLIIQGLGYGESNIKALWKLAEGVDMMQRQQSQS